jgi:hypothetical protein
VKNVRKRSVDSITQSTTLPPNAAPLSENVNLFQSLRVLQEGESEEERNVTLTRYGILSYFFKTLLQTVSAEMDPNSVCLKTGWFSALLALGGGAMCLLGGALLATCTRMRRVAIDKVLASSQFNGYMNHKGSIN